MSNNEGWGKVEEDFFLRGDPKSFDQEQNAELTDDVSTWSGEQLSAAWKFLNGYPQMVGTDGAIHDVRAKFKKMTPTTGNVQQWRKLIKEECAKRNIPLIPAKEVEVATMSDDQAKKKEQSLDLGRARNAAVDAIAPPIFNRKSREFLEKDLIARERAITRINETLKILQQMRGDEAEENQQKAEILLDFLTINHFDITTFTKQEFIRKSDRTVMAPNHSTSFDDYRHLIDQYKDLKPLVIKEYNRRLANN